MNEFLAWTWEARLCITFLLGLCILSQTSALVLTYYSSRLGFSQVFKVLLEASVLAEVFVLTLLHGRVVTNYVNGLVAPVGYNGLRLAVLGTTAILAITVCLLARTLWPLVVLPACAISLPAIEMLTGRALPWAFVSILAFWLCRSIIICVRRFAQIRTSISVLSVKNAVDALHTGVLFCEEDGHILLSNRQMQSLMIAITGRIHRNAKQFYDCLVRGENEPNCQKTELEGQMVYLLPDGAAWMFTRIKIPSRVKTYTHISAADVSEVWALTMELQQKDRALRQKSGELKDKIANLHILSKEGETQRAKTRVHDILGQRLTVLLRTIRSKQQLDVDLFAFLSKGLMDELKANRNVAGPADELNNIRQIFTAIGVDITFEGRLPKNIQQAQIFIDIIRESATNAVRHGLATRISIKSKLSGDAYHLTITNNGRRVLAPITPGGGITGMKKQVETHGGILNINTQPLFKLYVVLPEGEKDD